MRNPFVVHRPPRARAVLGPFLAAVVLATLSPAHAAEQTPAPGVAAAPTLTLGEAIASAVAQNPGLRSAAAAAAGADARRGEARSALLPQVNAMAGATMTDHPVHVFGMKLLQDDLGPSDMAFGELTGPDARTDWTARLDLQANVVDVANWYGLTAATRAAEAGEAALRSAEAQLVARVVAAYHGAQLAEARRAVATEVVASARADVERATAQVQSGVATQSDLLGLQAALAALEEEAIVSTGDAELARAELERLIGSDRARTAVLATPLDAAPPAIEAGVAPRADHPDLARAEAGVAAAEAAATRATLSWLPTLGVQASVEGHRESVGDEGGNAWFAGAFLRFNVFSGLGDAARIDGAAAEADRIRAERDDARAAIGLALRRAHLQVEQAGGRVRVTTEAVNHARESHRLVRARFENGVAQAADVLRARTALLEAETRHLSALFARHMAAAHLAAAEGALDRHWTSRSAAR
jgi:outer membrane protein TolC